MMPVKWRLYARILLTCVLLLCVLSAGWRFLSDVDAMHSSISVRTAAAPFLYRPYYGRQSIVKRTISFFDHDKPWYVHDRTFVRYDGKTWRKASLADCHSGVNCYDGHNGYDLKLFFEPVLSAASGRVVRAGWYNPTNHNASFGLWVAIDHGNGMATSYGHLSAITVAVGDHVGSQWQIGTSGSTGSATGPHLHMSAYYMPRWLATDPYGWSGSRRDPNVVPDRYLWTDNPNARDSAPDLGRRAPYPGAIVVDDKGPTAWKRTGNWTSSPGKSDIGGHLHWTTTTSGRATATATWTTRLRSPGRYEVGVFVNDNHATSSWAPYTIYSSDPHHPGTVVRHVVHVDMEHIGSFAGPLGHVNTGPVWVSLGSYYFHPAHPARVVLSNATGGNGSQLAADAVEFVRHG